MELLAPAGTMKNFMAALEAGADAIFLGGKLFNARSSAGNFDKEELREALRRAHLLGVDVHVTVNILVGDKEFKALKAYIRDLVDLSVDALIVQDLGVAKVIREIAPTMPIHASTQLSVTNLETVNRLGKLGFTRVVLGREVSLEEIKYICANTDVEIEVFIHGALCICYSGQCFMSSYIGGRSGNRGSCAQPCRKPYELLNGEGKAMLPSTDAYIMSPKDLNSADYIKALLEAGVSSFKIEGRMKKVSYVKSVVGAYRAIIDEKGTVSKEQRKRLEEGFNRGFSQAYLENRAGKEMMTVVAPNNQGKYLGTAKGNRKNLTLHIEEELLEGDLLKLLTNTNEVLYFTVSPSWQKKVEKGQFIYTLPVEAKYEAKVYKAASALEENGEVPLSTFGRKIPVYAYLDGKEGEPVSLTFMTDTGLTVTVQDEYLLAKALKRPTSLEKITEQLNRLGNTLFSLEEVHAPEGEFMWPASVLNNLRREATLALEGKLLELHRTKAIKRPCFEAPLAFPSLTYPEEVILSVRCDELEQVEAALEGGAKKIIFGGERFNRAPYTVTIYEEIVKKVKEKGALITLALPRIIKEGEVKAYKETLEAMVKAEPHAISIHFIGALDWLRELGYKGAVEGDFGLNVFNSEALAFWERFGLSSVMMSPEATLKQIKGMAHASSLPVETLVQGQTEMMISEYCTIGSFLGNGVKENCPRPCMKDHFSLKDTKGEVFPLRTDPYCRMHILNSKELDMAPYVKELKAAKVRILRIEARGREASYVKEQVNKYRNILDGNSPVFSKEQQGITRGHYFKGIF